jgi:hypothetical protein
MKDIIANVIGVVVEAVQHCHGRTYLVGWKLSRQHAELL